MANFAKKVLQANHFITEVGFGIIKFTQEDVKKLCGASQGMPEVNSSKALHCEQDAILNLKGNGMSSREATVIASFLNSNPSLAGLNLNYNRFSDTDAAVLANSLSSNTHLMNVSAYRNGIEENGRLAFLRAVFDVSSLSSCAASNHTCKVDGLERDISVINSYESSSVNKWSKILAMLALSSKDLFINTVLLRGVPAQLIPVILEKYNDEWCTDDYQELTDIYLELTNTARCQKHDVWDSLGERKSLNCMYNLMRSWNAIKALPVPHYPVNGLPTVQGAGHKLGLALLADIGKTRHGPLAPPVVEGGLLRNKADLSHSADRIDLGYRMGPGQKRNVGAALIPRLDSELPALQMVQRYPLIAEQQAPGVLGGLDPRPPRGRGTPATSGRGPRPRGLSSTPSGCTGSSCGGPARRPTGPGGGRTPAGS
ncbi:hypothetical protein THAOC_06809 [Thalassiosira oceanica]|uniref:Uncharacterized protein n=1 Tax=Thalassiosira oceanica TaxID=159749 RepID=K0T3R4_THAOC|nr:hypothetical protein THAOC_06809 [Thalassiosira oceanica]|eukprot:EJK71724.1 hypothetical protein THAOC_06809 [Thalassiosira oceanica]